jgi:hypothetical protein
MLCSKQSPTNANEISRRYKFINDSNTLLLTVTLYIYNKYVYKSGQQNKEEGEHNHSSSAPSRARRRGRTPPAQPTWPPPHPHQAE